MHIVTKKPKLNISINHAWGCTKINDRSKELDVYNFNELQIRAIECTYLAIMFYYVLTATTDT